MSGLTITCDTDPVVPKTMRKCTVRNISPLFLGQGLKKAYYLSSARAVRYSLVPGVYLLDYQEGTQKLERTSRMQSLLTLVTERTVGEALRSVRLS